MSATATSIYEIPLTTIDGKPTTLEPYRGQVLLVVNVASKCGFTGQYKGLEELYRKYKDRGLVILGFPCNQFMGQEPGNAEEIQSFCSLEYDVTFPMFAKVDVNGASAHPLYHHLKSAARGTLGTRGIKWNFTKFLVDRTGNVVSRHGPMTAPQQLGADIEKLLG
ncbi:MAG TPA: glutathione peroxidase [Gemmata sp.]